MGRKGRHQGGEGRGDLAGGRLRTTVMTANRRGIRSGGDKTYSSTNTNVEERRSSKIKRRMTTVGLRVLMRTDTKLPPQSDQPSDKFRNRIIEP